MSDEESSQSSSDINDDDEEGPNNPKNSTSEEVWNTTTNSKECEDDQKVPTTEQLVNEPYNPEENDRVVTGGLADPSKNEKPSDDGINEHDLQKRKARTTYTVVNHTQQLETDSVGKSKVVCIVESLRPFEWKEMDTSINTIC